MNAKKYGKIAYDGLITNNATFKLVLGTCATLGMSTSASLLTSLSSRRWSHC